MIAERPFDRKTRTIVYERAKGIPDTISFGNDKDIMKAGYEWALHSVALSIIVMLILAF